MKLNGPPLKRGRQHGEELRSSISKAVSIWRDRLERAAATRFEDYIDDFLSQTNFEAALNRVCPHLLEEVIGLSEGSGIPFKTILAYQLMDEEWWFRVYRKADTRLSNIPEACTAIGFTCKNQTETIIAQNMDIGGMESFQAVLEIEGCEDAPNSWIFTYAGLIALTGVNSAGVASCTNTLYELNHSAAGMPVAFFHRLILECKTAKQAADILTCNVHASGQNYLFGDRHGVYSLECSAERYEYFWPTPNRALVYHTNHPLVNTDNSQFETLRRRGQIDAFPNSTSRGRLKAVEERLFNWEENRLDAEFVKALLSSTDDPRCPISRFDQNGADSEIGFTLGSVVYVLEDSVKVYFAGGPPSHTPYMLSTLR
ncbi:MAG: C45 family peptidase [Pseudomonadota bacterium]